MPKSLDEKLADIHADPGSEAFLLADAKDADMAFGTAAPGRSPEHADGEFRTLAEYRDGIRANTRQALVDIMLMSVSTNELLTIRERLFDASPVTPAIRANDTTDIHAARGASYPREPARPFRTALLDHARCGRIDCDRDEDDRADPPPQQHLGANLGLFSVTFNNDVELDRAMLNAYRDFRIEAERKGFRHFLEVFVPNAPVRPVPPEQLGGFLNDQVVRALAGVPQSARPLFLKLPYTGPAAMEELARYDPHLVPGVLGGSAGTTYDAFKLIAEARAHGARAALYGRKINNAEHQLSFIQFLRWLADGQIGPEEAVRAYHGVLQGLGIKPHRPLANDLKLTETSLSYAGSGPGVRSTVRVPATPSPATREARSTAASRSVSEPPQAARSTGEPSAGTPPSGDSTAGNGDGAVPLRPDGAPDFAGMTPEQRLAYHRDRLRRI